MAKARSFQKLEAWYRKRHRSAASEMSLTAARRERRADARHRSHFVLESLEARILLSGDLGTAMPMAPSAQTVESPAIVSVVTQPQLAAVTQPNNGGSPHFSYLNVADFGRSYGETSWGSPSSPSRTEAAVQWYAQHVDLTEQQGAVTHFKLYNPNIRSWRYALDLYQFENEVTSLPESSFLHVSEPTSVTLKDLSGNVLANYTIPTGGRFEFAVWNAKHFAFNLKDVNLRNYNSQRILNLIGDEAGVFLDAHATGFADTFQVGQQTTVNFGGGIREYGGLRAGDPALDTAYQADVISWLTQLRGSLNAAGKWGVVNQATNLAYEQSARDQAVAIGGFNTENLIAPDSLRGADSVWVMYDLTQRVTSNGGTAILTGKWNFVPGTYTQGSYGSAEARQDIWRLAFYYMVKEPAGSSGRTYFDLTLPSYYTNDVPTDQHHWYAAYQVDVGQPTSGMTVAQNGTSPSDGAPYTVFTRAYSKAQILFRTRDLWSSTDYSDRSGVTVPLNGDYQQVKEDGTLGPIINSIRIRNGEGMILLPALGANVAQNAQPVAPTPAPVIAPLVSPAPAPTLINTQPDPMPVLTAPTSSSIQTKTVEEILTTPPNNLIASNVSTSMADGVPTASEQQPIAAIVIQPPPAAPQANPQATIPETSLPATPPPAPPIVERSYTVAEMLAMNWRTSV